MPTTKRRTVRWSLCSGWLVLCLPLVSWPPCWGVVNTMGSVGQPPSVLGGMIASALVGTFLGILLAYALVEPMACLVEHNVQDASKEFDCIKCTLIASMQGYNPPTAIEFGRKVLFSTERPGFLELESHVKGKK